MSTAIVNPIYWSTADLIGFGHDTIHSLALSSAATLNSYRLVLGRCLLAVDETKLYQQFGYSGAVHYAIRALGLRRKEAQTLRRVARCLQDLPQLSRELELGRIGWSKVRDIVSKASPETEAVWLELAKKRSQREIQRLVKYSEHGKLPWDSLEEMDSERVRVVFQVSPEAEELFDRASQSLSRKLGKPVSVAAALEHLVIEHLAKRPVDTKVTEAVRGGIGKDRLAARARDSRLILEAKALTEELALGAQSSTLFAALGSDYVVLAHEADSPARDHGAKESTSGNVVGKTTGDALDDATEVRAQGQADGPSRDCSNFAAMPLDEALGIARRTPCPGSPELQLLQRDKTGWQNSRLRFNPKARGTTPAQRTALLRRDGYCCSTPDCPNRLWLEAHHLVKYSRNGKTIPESLVILCSRCHKNVHLGLLKIQGNANHVLTFTDLQGRPVERPHPMEVAGWLDFWLGWSGHEDNCHKARAA